MKRKEKEEVKGKKTAGLYNEETKPEDVDSSNTSACSLSKGAFGVERAEVTGAFGQSKKFSLNQLWTRPSDGCSSTLCL